MTVWWVRSNDWLDRCMKKRLNHWRYCLRHRDQFNVIESREHMKSPAHGFDRIALIFQLDNDVAVLRSGTHQEPPANIGSFNSRPRAEP